MAKKAYRGGLPRASKRGDVRPEIGGKRFRVGNEKTDAVGTMRRRLTSLRDLFDKQCEHYQIDFWSAAVLPWARKVERGEPLIFEVSERAKKEPGQASEEAEMLALLQSIGLFVVTDDPATIATGEGHIKALIDAEVHRAVSRALAGVGDQFSYLPPELRQRVARTPADPANIETRGLHEAFNAYRAHLEKTGKRLDNGKLAPSPSNYRRACKNLIGTHDNVPLWQIDYDAIDRLFAYWRNRPENKKSKEGRISHDHAHHTLTVLWAFLTWVDRSADWRWTLPRHTDKISRTPIDLDSDYDKLRSRRISTSIYTPDELATIAKTLDSFGKLILGLCVNCGSQGSETGRIEIGDYYPTHPETGEAGPWIIFNRKKTREYGEWVLWPEVDELVRWGIERAKKIGARRLIVKEDGTPMYREDLPNMGIYFSKWWQAKPSPSCGHRGVITKIIEKNPDFPRHTIKFLRKILPSAIRPNWGSEVADLANARKVGNGNGNRQTDRYSDRPYEKVAAAIRTLEKDFRPFLDALTID